MYALLHVCRICVHSHWCVHMQMCHDLRGSQDNIDTGFYFLTYLNQGILIACPSLASPWTFIPIWNIGLYRDTTMSRFVWVLDSWTYVLMFVFKARLTYWAIFLAYRLKCPIIHWIFARKSVVYLWLSWCSILFFIFCAFPMLIYISCVRHQSIQSRQGSFLFSLSIAA